MRHSSGGIIISVFPCGIIPQLDEMIGAEGCSQVAGLIGDFASILNTGCFKKTLFYVFANISANTYSREMSRISTELAWQEASNDMREN